MSWLGRDTRSDLTPVEWISALSRYNVVRNTHFGRKWEALYKTALSISYNEPEFIKNLGPLCVQGGSRDDPIPMFYCCTTTPNCKYKTTCLTVYRQHVSTCTPQLVAAGETLQRNGPGLQCPYEGCYFTVGPNTKDPRYAIKAHIKDKHEFQAKPCEHGCDPSHLYHSAKNYRNHIKRFHPPNDSAYPACCTFPGCPSSTAFLDKGSLSTHLMKMHSVAAEDKAKYLPQEKPNAFAGAKCAESGCNASFPKGSLYRYKAHLKKVHGKNDNEIEEITSQPHLYQYRALSTRAVSSKFAARLSGSTE